MVALLDSVAEELRAGLSRCESAESRAAFATEAVTSFGEPGRLAGLLGSMLADRRQLERSAAGSYRHPLGFEKLALIDAEPAFMLRVHVWRPDEPAGTEHIHDHRFGFATAIVRGGYDMEMFAETAEGATGSAAVTEYRESGGAQAWELQPVRTTAIRRLARLRMCAGASYYIDQNTLHRVLVPAGAHCVTLFLETAVTRTDTRIMSDGTRPMAASTTKHTMGTDLFAARLRRLSADLGCL